MTGYIKVEESYVESLVKNAAWDAARVSLVEVAEKQAKKEVEEASDSNVGGDKSIKTAGEVAAQSRRLKPGETSSDQRAKDYHEREAERNKKARKDPKTKEMIKNMKAKFRNLGGG